MLLGPNIYHRTYRIAIAGGEGKNWRERRGEAGMNAKEGRTCTHEPRAQRRSRLEVNGMAHKCMRVLEVQGDAGGLAAGLG